MNVLSGPNSNWILDPKWGLTLKNVSLQDSGLYECVGTLHNTSDWKDFAIVVSGILSGLSTIDGMYYSRTNYRSGTDKSRWH